MKQASLVRLFSWLVVMALAATLMPPAVSSNAYVTQREATASAPEALLAASAADAPLSSSVALDVAGSSGFCGRFGNRRRMTI